MQFTKPMVVLAASCGALMASAAMARGLDARSVGEVDSIWVESNSCLGDIGDELRRAGFHVTHNPRNADAALEVDVFDREYGRYDSSAQYEAKLRGDDGRVIFTASGTEVAGDYRDVCEDIGDTIAEGLRDMG